MHARSSQPLRIDREKQSGRAIRVMVIDDSLTVRTVLARTVEDEGGMKVVGTFSNAERALVKLRELQADVILLDLEMPGMGGLEALPRIQEVAPEAQVLVVSSLTLDGAEHTLSALSMGAADTMPKPLPGGFDTVYRANLLDKVRALGSKKQTAHSAEVAPTTRPSIAISTRSRTPEAIAIGASTGGIHALNSLLRRLPPELDLPILVTQHLPGSFMTVFARQIQVASGRPAIVAEDGTEIRNGEIIVAPGDGHMIITRIGDTLQTKLSKEPASSGCMPSVDPMIASLSEALNGRALAVILSGMGRDGVDGVAQLVEAGGMAYVQDAESSAVWGMPGSVAKAGLAEAIEPPEKLAELISRFAKVPAWK